MNEKHNVSKKQKSDNCEQIAFDFEYNKSNPKIPPNKVDSKKLKSSQNDVVYYSNKNELPILHLYNNLILYVYRIFAKIKTNEELTKSIYNELSYCHNQLFLAKTFKDKKMKYKYLLLATASVDYLTATMRIVKKLKLITPKNYTVWSYKIAGIDKSLQKWMISCQKP